MIYNYVSSKQLIAKVFRDFGIQEEDWINDAIEWIGEALELIGTSKQTVGKLRIAKASDFRIGVPKDLYILDTVRYADIEGSERPDIDDFKYVASEGQIDNHPGLYGQQRAHSSQAAETYFFQGNFIKFSFEEKWVALEYKAFALDDDGYPLIPDAAEYKEALSWYIMSKLLLRGRNHPVLKYQVADQKWERKCVQARNAMNMPDKGQYRNFRDKWVTMIPRYDRSMEQLEDAVTAQNVVEQSYTNKIKG